MFLVREVYNSQLLASALGALFYDPPARHAYGEQAGQSKAWLKYLAATSLARITCFALMSLFAGDPTESRDQPSYGELYNDLTDTAI